MTVTLPILLLIFGGLTFWVLNESKLKWYFKSACITTFCVFTVVFWSSIHTFLGWPALEKEVPDKVLLHWVIIKEPNKLTESKGRIYLLIESGKYSAPDPLAKFFGYKKENVEPRLYGIKYNRELHERLEKQIMPKLKQGQPVLGKLTKKGEEGKSKIAGKDKGKKQDGEGSESQMQDWQFHELRPSDIQGKPIR
ncbi:hypothetical protein [uncultured Maribacter sp.]|uniref:hypothetical protein n=1 Tax=uncultured Maribacter sp. TaxID=431308 RepID=UPI0030DBBEBB